MIGKKQRDIREDNKSLVIDSLLNSEMTTANLEDELKLSHTALLKVINELKSLGIVRNSDTQVGKKGRPSQVYDINPDCAFAATIALGYERIEIFVVDMKGFQVNKFTSSLSFSSAREFVDFSLKKLVELLQHERTKSTKLSTICVSLPVCGIGEDSFVTTKNIIQESFKNVFDKTEIEIKNNNEYWARAEEKYGILKRFKSGALLCEFEGFVSMAFYYDKMCYSGNEYKENSITQLSSEDICMCLERKISLKMDEIIERYNQNDKKITQLVNEIVQVILDRIKKCASFLNVDLIIFSGALSKLGTPFLSFLRRNVGNDIEIAFSQFTDRSPSCAGAIFVSSYDSLKSLL